MTNPSAAGRAFVWLTEVASTNDWARQQAKEQPDILLGATWVVAERQTAGRGRFGNEWQSLKGNLSASLLFRPDRPAAQCAQLSFVASLAVADTLVGYAPRANIRLKWPNDVLAEGRKIAGILLESETGFDGRLSWLVIGIGINLSTYPKGIDPPAISLAALGIPPPAPFDRNGRGGGAVEHLDDAFTKWYEVWERDGFAAIREAWLARAQGLGSRIRARLANEEIRGVFRDIDDTGALVIGLSGGATRTIAAGEVYF